MDRLERAGWGAAILLALAPVLLVPGAATNDGPSHLYNAWVAAGVAGGDPVLAPVFGVDRGIGQNLASATALQALGPLIGWDLAERLWLGALLLGLLLAVAWWVRRDGAPPSPLTPLLLAWLPLSLVTAWGFYDFLLGAALFPLLLDALDRGGIGRILLVLLGLFLVHLFVFAAGVALLVLRSTGRRDLRIPTAAAAAIGVVVLATSDVLGVGISWDVDWGQRLLHVAFSNLLYTVSAAGIAAGVVWTGLAGYGLVRLPRGWPAWAGGTLLLVAVLSPTVFAGGSFTFERTHLLALIALAPIAARAGARLPTPAAGTAAAVLLAALGLTFAGWTSAGHVLDADRAEIRALFREIDVPASRLRVASALPVARLKVGRAVFHEHVADRAAMDLGLVAADDYEADSPAYPVTWKGDRRGLRIRRAGRTLHLDGRLPPDTYIVHEPGARFAGYGATPAARGSRFVVSRIREHAANPRAARPDPPGPATPAGRGPDPPAPARGDA